LPRKIQFIGGKKSNLSEIDDGSINTEQVRASAITAKVQRYTRTHAFCDGACPGTIEMTPSSSIRCVYDPDTLSIMTNALDRACETLPFQFRDSEHMRRKLALHIMRQINDGESDPARLAGSAILSVLW
jgi:hypothetical protein